MNNASSFSAGRTLSSVPAPARLTAVLLSAASLLFSATVAHGDKSGTPRPDPRLRDESRYLFGVLGRSGDHLPQLREAGVQAKVLEFSWKKLFSEPAKKNQAYVESQRQRLAALREHGFLVVLNIGVDDAPEWVHRDYPDTRYVNQFGDRYEPAGPGGKPFESSGAVNCVFNPHMRALMEAYIAALFADFPGDSFDAVRLGFSRFGEIQYPLPSENGKPTYWAFDANAQRACPVPGWRPGQASPNGEARRFAEWYLEALKDTQLWELGVIRRHFSGPVFALYPNWGLRPGQIEEACAKNLGGATFAERKGQLALGLDFKRLVESIRDPGVWVYTTCLNKSDLVHASDNPQHWSPVHYLSSLAEAHPLKLQLMGENAAPHERFYMEWTMEQMARYNLRGLFWAFEYQLFDTQTEWSHFASLDDLRDLIRQYNLKGRPASAK